MQYWCSMQKSHHAKKLLCKNFIVKIWRCAKVSLCNNATVKNCHREKMSPCKNFPSCKSDDLAKVFPCAKVTLRKSSCKSDAVQKCPLVLKWRSCKRAAVQKWHFVQKWRSCKSDRFPYFKDDNQSSQLKYKENDKFKILNFINNTMFRSLETSQTRSSVE